MLAVRDFYTLTVAKRLYTATLSKSNMRPRTSGSSIQNKSSIFNPDPPKRQNLTRGSGELHAPFSCAASSSRTLRTLSISLP